MPGGAQRHVTAGGVPDSAREMWGRGAEGWAGAQGENLGGKGRARQAPEVAEGASLRVSGWSRRVLGRERWPAGA